VLSSRSWERIGLVDVVILILATSCMNADAVALGWWKVKDWHVDGVLCLERNGNTDKMTKEETTGRVSLSEVDLT
jgi:hypothetical protein